MHSVIIKEQLGENWETPKQALLPDPATVKQESTVSAPGMRERGGGGG